MGNIIYRRSIKEDSPFINNLFVEMVRTVNSRMKREGENVVDNFEQGFEEGYLDRFYINDDRLIYVALDDDKVIGFISVINKKDMNSIYLDDYCVHESYRGQGIGSKLMQMSFDFAKSQGYDQVITHVQGANKESVEFYWKKGFKLVEVQNNVSANRYLIRRVENHLPIEEQQRISNYNNTILNKILDKVKNEYSDSIDLIGIGGSFCSGLYHEKSDLDLLIIANKDVDDLSKCYIAEGIGQDIYYKHWDNLEKMSQYDNMFVTKLKDLNIVYYRDETVLQRYKELQDRLNENMNNEEKNKQTIDNYYSSIINKKKRILSTDNLNELYILIGSMMNDIENLIYINNKEYSFGGTKNILCEIYYMPNKPDNFINEYKKILDLTNIDDIKAWATSITNLLSTYLNKNEDDVQIKDEEVEQVEKKDITKNDLIGTYEELYSNYYNKLVYATRINNKFLSFRTMIDAQGFFDEFTGVFNLPEFSVLDKYNPNDLNANVDAFTLLLNKWKALYDEFRISVEEYDSIDELYNDTYNKKLD